MSRLSLRQTASWLESRNTEMAHIPPSKKTRKTLAMLLREKGVGTHGTAEQQKAERAAWYSRVLERPIDSSENLSVAEGIVLVDFLRGMWRGDSAEAFAARHNAAMMEEARQVVRDSFALKHRRCAFPGCNSQRGMVLDMHEIIARGTTNAFDKRMELLKEKNLIMLCREHHTMMHAGGQIFFNGTAIKLTGKQVQDALIASLKARKRIGETNEA